MTLPVPFPTNRTNCIISTIASSATLLLLFSGVCRGLVETCEELQAAFDLTKTQDVVVEMHPFQDIDCEEFTTMTMDSNSLTVESSEGDVTNFFGNTDLNQVRFEVTNGAKLVWETNAKFVGSEGHDVNGGALFIGKGSSARFRSNLGIVDYGIRSVKDEGDYSSYVLSGGCVYTDGYLRVDGVTTFVNCEVVGGGESPPGPGGALYVGPDASVLFSGALEISDVSIIDDDGGNGGAIYNEGKVNVKGDAKFENLNARSGGAIFNSVGAQFRFKKSAKAIFIDCTANDGTAGALDNRGFFMFSGPALFVDTYTPAIYISSDGNTILSENSVFWDKYDEVNSPAIRVSSGGKLTIPDSVTFVDSDTQCNRVDDDTCP